MKFVKFFPLVSDTVPMDVRTDIAAKLNQLLITGEVDQDIIDSVVDLAKFVRTISDGLKKPKGTVQHEPTHFTEEWYWVEYKLLTASFPLRNQSTDIPGNAQLDYPSPFMSGNAEDGGEMPRTADIRDKKMLISKTPLDIIPTQSSNLLEPALRLAAVLYVEAVVPDVPRSVNNYGVLLILLSYQLKVVTTSLSERKLQRELGLMLDERVDMDGLPSMIAIRPVVIWACLIGYVVSILAEEDRIFSPQKFDRTIYRRCLAQVIGPHPDEVDNLSEWDLQLCRLLGVENIQLSKWDDRTFLKYIMMGGDN
jgi:hypothetical protein